MRKVNLNMKQDYKYQIIKDCSNKRISKHGAAHKLGISIRQVNRLLNKYQLEGKSAFIHGNTNNIPHNKINSEKSDFILNLYKTKYDQSNVVHFCELLEEYENIIISPTFVRTLLHENLIFPPRTTKKKEKLTIQKHKQQIQNEQLNSSNSLIVDNKEIPIEVTHPSKERKKYFGEEIQMDASHHIWFGETKSQLHAAIDNSTGTIVGMFFDWQETLHGYYQVYKQILLEYGIPYEFSTDRRTVFEYKKKAPSIEKDTYTQFAYACKQFGTYIKTSSVPQAKGQIERLFGTLQSRLITELKIRNITTIDAANEFLPEFIKQFNSKFALQINNNMSVFEVVKNQDDIYNFLSIRTPRIIDSGSCIRYNNKKYYPAIDGERKYFNYRTKALVFKTLNDNLYVTIGDEVYNMVELDLHQKISKEFDKVVPESKSRKTYRPPIDHPWRQYAFNKFVDVQRHNLNDTSEHMYEPN